MKHETQSSKPKEICFQMKLNIANLDQILPIPHIEAVQEEHHAHLVIDGIKSIKLKIYHSDKDYLGEKLARWLQDQEDGLALAKNIEIVSINDREDVFSIDFSESQYNTFSISTANNEGGKQFFLIGLERVRLCFKRKRRKKLPESEFYLNVASKKIVDPMYAYHGFSPFHGENIWKAQHYYDEYQSFGEIKYKLDYHFFAKRRPDSDTDIIYKEPRLQIKHTGLSESEILLYANLICSLISIYAHEKVSYNFARIHLSNYTATISYEEKLIIPRKGMHLGHLDFHGKILDLINNIDCNSSLPKSNFIGRIIDKYNLCYIVSGETEFLILFNILEQLRSDIGEGEKKRDSYIFILPDKEVDEFIKQKIQEIGPIIHEDERDVFLKQAIGQYQNLKRKTMRGQFERLFQHYQVDGSFLQFDFKEIQKLRNDLVHGGFLDGKLKKVEKANEVMRELCGKLILQMLGVPGIRFGKLANHNS